MNQSDGSPKSRSAEAAEDVGSNPSVSPTLGDVIALRMSRRDLVGGLLATTAVGTALSQSANAAPLQSSTTPNFNFTEVPAGSDEALHVA